MNAPRRVAPEAPSRRGWCPSLARPMPTGDGLLARVHPPLGRLTAAQARAVADAARRFGNGHVDVTARANLQIRGVTEASRCGLAEALAAAGLGDVRHDGGPQRLTLTTPLAGFEPAGTVDVPALARRIEAIGLEIAGLPPKSLVAVESDVHGIALGPAEADLHCVAIRGGLALHLAGDAAWWRLPDDGETIVEAALRLLAASGQRRMRDVFDVARAEIPARFALPPIPAPAASSAPSPGAFPLPTPVGPERGSPRSAPPVADGPVALLVDAPFGRGTADALGRLADTADAAGAADLRLSPTRGVLLVCVDAGAAETARRALAEAGFLTRADDPRGAVAACPGAPACASGSTPTLHDAARLAEAFRPFAARGLRAHVSGCPKGCAHPGAADLTLVGRDGRYDVVLSGRPDALPATRLPFEAALERVRRADSALSLAQIVPDPPPGPRPS
ncbi:hypothetical protein ASF49_00590 [Methylobacterium sp. Leaf104]|uniref:precorrin-3B synthase n=1 Tax=Methylobacterium TaxID=407 RepID=UPI0006FF096E|nr:MULTISPECIES: precorrin-3B synthase [Methylobacterium]KQP42392.1 hypothetical protein ASF49_00590 [Methylobacterium sp. Leaf104]MCI9879084.1 precorrin-3B synthase [Methylobacterium goesingense]